MSWLLCLMLVELVFFVIAWLITKGDISSPSVVVLAVFIISTLFNIYATDLWDNSYFYFESFLAVSIGLTAVVLAEIVNIQMSKKKKLRLCTAECGISYIQIPKLKVYLVVTTCLMFTLLYYLNIRSIGHSIGLNVSSAISVIKTNSQDVNMKMNIFVRQGYKIIMIFAYLGLFVFLNNIIYNKHTIKHNFMQLIPLVCFVIVCILSGGRVEIIRVLSAAFFLFVFFVRQKKMWENKAQKKANKMVLKIGIPLVIVVAVFLVQIRTITKGNITSNEISNIMDYIAYYVGSSIQVLNIKINKGILNYRMPYWGELTFRGIWNFLSQLGFTKDYIRLNISKYEYLMIHRGIGGNTDTFVGPPLFDFGYVGMFIVLFVEFLALGKIYHRKLMYTFSSYKRDKILLLYAFCFFIVTLSYYDNCLYAIISLNGVITIILLLLGYWFYFKARLKIGSRRL